MNEAQLRKMMLSNAWPDKARVLACLCLCSTMYGSEAARVLNNGKWQYVSRSYIARMTGIESRRVIRAMRELLSEGWIERTALNEQIKTLSRNTLLTVMKTPRTETEKIKDGYVYFAEPPDGQTVKIGFTSHPAKRLSGLNTSRPKDQHLTITATMRGDRKTEARLHRDFSDERIEAEWFTKSERIAEFVKRLQKAA